MKVPRIAKLAFVVAAGVLSTEVVLDTAGSGNSNSGHDYGTKLSDNEKRDLMEYLKTL